MGNKQKGKRWPGENCPLRREFWIWTWHVRLVAATGGRLIKSPRFSSLSTNTNLTFYCNCSNAHFTISTPPSDCLLASTPLKVHIVNFENLWSKLNFFSSEKTTFRHYLAHIVWYWRAYSSCFSWWFFVNLGRWNIFLCLIFSLFKCLISVLVLQGASTRDFTIFDVD